MKLGHFVRDYVNPTKTYSYCKYFDHTIEQCLQLIVKWKATNVGNPVPLHNPNPNPNQNIQRISIEPREPNIGVMIRGSVATGAYQYAQHDQPWVQPMTQNKVPFDDQK